MVRVNVCYYCPGCYSLLATKLGERFSQYNCPYCSWEGLDYELIPECDVYPNEEEDE